MKFQTPGETYEERERYWLQRITEARKYPGGILKYCRDHDITKEVYYHWFNRLKDRVDGWQVPLDTNRKRRTKPPKTKSNRQASKPRPRQEWAALVAECVRKRSTPPDFARKNDLHKVTFCRWYRRLSNLPVLTSTPASTTEPSFVQVKVIESAPTKKEARAASSSALEIILSNGKIIRLRELDPEIWATG